MAEETKVNAGLAGTIDVGGDLTVNRLGFGAMRITGDGIWGPPPDRAEALAVLRRAVDPAVPVPPAGPEGTAGGFGRRPGHAQGTGQDPAHRPVQRHRGPVAPGAAAHPDRVHPEPVQRG